MAKTTYIAVAGNVGCGKSTLVDFVCRNYKVEPFFEPNAQNPYLANFYADMKKWAFHSQIYFLTHKFRIHQELEQERRKRTVVQDRTIFEDAEVFAAMLRRRRLINKRDWGVYQDLYKSIVSSLASPDLMIYLAASVRTIRRRIKIRGRPEEQAIPVSYIRGLNRLYEEWFGGYKRSPTITIDTDNLDYITDLVDRIGVLKTIEKYL
ncbi:deoxynucleoside kinase [Myxococcota bacterium]